MLPSLALFASTTLALAQDPVDIGVIKQSDMRVVQKLLYPKAERAEISFGLGWMPFDPYLTTPNLQVGFNAHRSENFAIGGVLGGGYGIKNGTYRTLERPPYGVAPDAYRYLASALVGVEWAPIYAKMNLSGKRILHHDVYLAGKGGVSLEQSAIPGGGIAVAPTVSIGLGARIFTGKTGAIRVELRDDMLVEHRKLTDSTHFKQNANLMIGYSILSKPKAKP